MRSFLNNRFSDYMYTKNSKSDKDLNNLIYDNHWNSNFEDNMKDLFSAYYKKDMNYNDKPDPLFKGFFDAVKETREFKDMTAKTKGNPVLSYYATKRMSEEMSKAIAGMFSDIQNKAKDFNNSPDKVKEDALKDAIEKSKDSIRAAMRHATKEVADDVEKVEDIIATCGIGDENGQPRSMDDIKSIIELANDLLNNPLFKEIIDMAGRVQRKANSVLLSKCNGQGEPVGIEFGKELDKLLATEYAMMDDPDLDTLFWKNYVSENLYQWEERGEEPQDKGPVIVAIDQSESMDGYKRKYSCSFLFGIYLVCKKSNRPLYVIAFDIRTKTYKIESETEIFKVMKEFLGGGTSFDAALLETINILKNEKEMEKADLIFITDGEDYIKQGVLDELMAYKKEISFNIIGAVIGYSYMDALSKFADKIFKIDSLTGTESVKFMEEAFSI